MKNQLFNFHRFINYSCFNLKMNSRSYWMQLLSIVLVIFGMLMFSMYKAKFFAFEGWMTVLVISGIVSVILLVAGAFPYLKKKETQIQFYMQPASIAEKFIFEFVLRFVGFVIVFPLLFWGVSELSYFLMGGIRAMRGLDMEGFRRVHILYDTLTSDDKFIEALKFIISGLLLGMAFIFSGTCTFMKHALIKTIGFVFGLGATIVYYMYFLTEQVGLKAAFVSSDDVGSIMYVLVAIFALLIIAFGYFKLKEKEV